MIEFISQSDSTILSILWWTAIITTGIFIVQTAMIFIGGDFDSELEFDADGDIDVDLDGDTSLDKLFNFLTVKNLMTFLMFFSWGAISLLIEGHSNTYAILFGLLLGSIATLALAWLFILISKLETNNTPTMDGLPGTLGKVYLRIPKKGDGAGKIAIMLNGSEQVIDAMSNGDAIPTDASIKVESILNESIAIVRAL